MPLVNATASEGPLSALHVRELADARKRATKIRRAAAVASFNGWTTGLFGTLSLLTGFWSLTALLLGLCLIAIAFNELHARKALLQFDPRGAVRLAYNQVFLAVVIGAYCLWSIRETLQTAGAGTSLTGDAGADAMLADVGGMARDITVMVYGVAIVLSGLIQGLTALYYLSRRSYIAAYRSGTPEWILRLNAEGTLDP
jgi:hypothetical protein